jgi:hypothetical protein
VVSYFLFNNVWKLDTNVLSLSKIKKNMNIMIATLISLVLIYFNHKVIKTKAPYSNGYSKTLVYLLWIQLICVVIVLYIGHWYNILFNSFCYVASLYWKIKEIKEYKLYKQRMRDIKCTDEIMELIKQNKVVVGMTMEEVLCSIGTPLDTNMYHFLNGIGQKLYYSDCSITLHNDKVITIDKYI